MYIHWASHIKGPFVQGPHMCMSVNMFAQVGHFKIFKKNYPLIVASHILVDTHP
jgi:hypothetical protein